MIVRYLNASSCLSVRLGLRDVGPESIPWVCGLVLASHHALCRTVVIMVMTQKHAINVTHFMISSLFTLLCKALNT